SWPELSAAVNCESLRCCWKAGEQPGRQTEIAAEVPWLEAAKPMSSSTIARVSGQKRRAQRGATPPWLWPMIEIFRPEIAYILRIACTTYSPATWRSPIELAGTAAL